MSEIDITILTDQRYVNPKVLTDYVRNVLREDELLTSELQANGLRVHRTNWDDKEFDWTKTNYIIFRSTWDYFMRFEEFSEWLKMVCKKTRLINHKELIYWNIDKHYMLDIEKKGVRIPNSVFIEKGDSRSLLEHLENQPWSEFVLKPCVSGGARHTYRFNSARAKDYVRIFGELIAKESMMIQEYQNQITTKGELAFMLFGGKFSHAVLKKAKPGDYRVQDDFGGSLHEYAPSKEEILFVENAVFACDPIPVYARVDILWNNEDELCVGEIELIEPELWFRKNEKAAKMCAAAIHEHIVYSA